MNFYYRILVWFFQIFKSKRFLWGFIWLHPWILFFDIHIGEIFTLKQYAAQPFATKPHMCCLLSCMPYSYTWYHAYTELLYTYRTDLCCYCRKRFLAHQDPPPTHTRSRLWWEVCYCLFACFAYVGVYYVGLCILLREYSKVNTNIVPGVCRPFRLWGYCFAYKLYSIYSTMLFDGL